MSDERLEGFCGRYGGPCGGTTTGGCETLHITVQGDRTCCDHWRPTAPKGSLVWLEARVAELEAQVRAYESAWREALDYGCARLAEVLTGRRDYEGRFTREKAAALAQSVLLEDIAGAYRHALTEDLAEIEEGVTPA